MSLKTSNYGAARSVLGLAEIIMWCGIGGGIILAVVAGGAVSSGFGQTGAGLAAALPGIAISVVCFIGLVTIQMAKATVDSADYSFQMLGIAREQLEISKQSRKQTAAVQSFAENRKMPPIADAKQTPVPAATGAIDTSVQAGSQTTQIQTAPAPDQTDLDYRGKRIHYTTNGSFLVEGKTFTSLEGAKMHVDGEVVLAKLAQPNGVQS